MTMHRILDEQTASAPLERWITASDGTALRLLHWPARRAGVDGPHTRAKGAVIMLHRGHEHAERLGHLAEEAGLDAYDLYAPDMRGHGGSGGGKGGGETVARLVADLEDIARAIEARDGHALSDMAVVAQSIGGVVAAAWVHDYAPPLRALVLAAPAFEVRLGAPGIGMAIRAAQRVLPRLRVPSYVTPAMLTQDEARAASYTLDPRITRDIPATLLIDLADTARRVVADAQAITVPVKVLMAREDKVIALRPVEAFVARLGGETREMASFKKLRHDILGERDRAPVLAATTGFIDRMFDAPAAAPDLTHADLFGWSRDEADALARPTEGVAAQLNWTVQRGAIALGTRLSRGMAIGRETGFDSGAALDYVYRNRAEGLGPLGRAIDRAYLDAIGWQGIRQRRLNLQAMVAEALDRLEAAGEPARVMDIAAGRGDYLLSLPQRDRTRIADLHLRDLIAANVAAGQARIEAEGLAHKARFVEGDAFDPDALAVADPRPTLAVVSGLYELFQENVPVAASLEGLAAAVPTGGYLIYTGQPWHPQVEMIARVLTSHRGGQRWVMRRRAQAEMDQLVARAGFVKRAQRIDRWGIFTVSLAERVEQA
ncbi:MAG: alpha/beta fold hydrolase [Pseudomonadota bacterium]